MKYRAIDIKEGNKVVAEGFYTIGEVTMFGVVDEYCSENKGDKTSLDKLGDIVLDMFTGKVDVNKKDIYANDIVEFQAGYDKEKYYGVVKWHDQRCGFYIETQKWITNDIISRGSRTNGKGIKVGNEPWKYATKMNKYKLKVVGNIRNNPELKEKI